MPSCGAITCREKAVRMVRSTGTWLPSLRRCSFEARRIQAGAPDPHDLHLVIRFHGLQWRAAEQDQVGPLAGLDGADGRVQTKGFGFAERGGLEELPQTQAGADQPLHL